jgi:peptidoglycan/LPS O-acetylase OafA/YrhL
VYQQLRTSSLRTDIQGLRAVAVMLVVFFHVGGWLRQGHIGVDIFFVISGFVISTAYFDRFVERPSLSTALSFLGRRVLRLMPALLVTVLATLLFTDLVFPPTENKSIALQAGIAAIFNYSNIFFIKSGTRTPWSEIRSCTLGPSGWNGSFILSFRF